MNQASAPDDRLDRMIPISRRGEWQPFLPLSPSTVYAMASRGEIRLVRIGAKTFIPASEIARLTAAGSAAR